MKKLLAFAFLVLSFNTLGNEVTQESPRETLEKALLAQQGNAVYIDFWASWCVPCLKSFPWMNKIQQQYKNQGFTVISINVDADKTKADKFLQDNPASFAVIYDPKGTIAQHFSIEAMPTSLLINREGKIMYRHSGFFTSKITQYENQLKQLINNTPTTTSNNNTFDKISRGQHEN